MNYSTAGANLFSVTVGLTNWCDGPGGGAIVYTTGWSYTSWSWGPYCINDGAKEEGPDANFAFNGSNPTVVHAIHTATAGVSYVFGCASIKGGESALRIGNLGGVSYTDDWGF